MEISIHTKQEAVALATALLMYTKNGLEAAGSLVQRTNEDPYYTAQRQFLRALEKFIENR